MVSFGFGFFELLILKRFVFGVTGIVSKVLKMLFFSQFFGLFWGGLIFIVHLGLEGLGVFVFVFLCCVAFVPVLFALFLVLWLVCFLFCFFFLFFVCFCFFLFCFIGGFKGQVRWPKGPPHLALNPHYFLVFVFCLLLFFVCFFLVFVFFVSVFLEGLRVR